MNDSAESIRWGLLVISVPGFAFAIWQYVRTLLHSRSARQAGVNGALLIAFEALRRDAGARAFWLALCVVVSLGPTPRRDRSLVAIAAIVTTVLAWRAFRHRRELELYLEQAASVTRDKR